MSDFQPFELKFWRKRQGLSQGNFAKLSGLSLNTIMKIEDGLFQVQKRTLIKLNQAVRDFEASLKKKTPELETQIDPNDDVAVRDYEVSLKKEAQSTDVNLDAPQAISVPTSSELIKAAPSETPVRMASPHIVLSNLDLELITRILTMTPIEKVDLLKSLIE